MRLEQAGRAGSAPPASPALSLRQLLRRRLLTAQEKRSPRASMILVLAVCGGFWAVVIGLLIAL